MKTEQVLGIVHFLDPEGCSHNLDIACMPTWKAWQDVSHDALASEPHELRTLVIDTGLAGKAPV